MPEHIVILTGAGISAESGLSTFRGSDGLWDNESIEEVATPEGFERNPEKVLRFYNERRRALQSAEPNPAHLALARLEERYRVSIITQNIDDLHERAGSTGVLHLHGELTKARSATDPGYRIDIGYRDIEPGERCPDGGQLRPHVVWFGEPVPAFPEAVETARTADRLLIVGTSLQVYPAASLIDAPSPDCPKVLVDPSADSPGPGVTIERRAEPASRGVPRLVDEWLTG